MLFNKPIIRLMHSVAEVASLHPKNRVIWDQMTAEMSSSFYDYEYLDRIYDRDKPYPEKSAYLCACDRQGQLMACIPGFVAQDIQQWILGLGIAMGTVLRRKDVPIKAVLKEFVAEVERISAEMLWLPTFQDFFGPAKDFLEATLDLNRWSPYPGLSGHLIDLKKIRSVAAFLESLTANADSQFGRKDLKKLLEGNLPVALYADFLREKRKGFPDPALVDQQAQTTALALESSRKEQTKILAAGEELKDLRYETCAITAPLLTRLFPLFENQGKRFGEPVPFLSMENLQQFCTFATGSNFLHIAWRGDEPIGFFLIRFARGVYHSLACGFDHHFSKAHSLYFNLTVLSVADALQKNAHTIDVGNGDEPLSASKVRFGAVAIPTTSFVLGSIA